MNIREVFWLSIKPAYGHVKHINSEIQMLTGFIPLTQIQVVKSFYFNLFVASRGILVQSSPTIVVERLYITFGMRFSGEMEITKTKTWGTSRFCANVCSPDRILYYETSSS